MNGVAGNKTFAEFFAGIGLVNEALRHSGWSCIYANDIDPKKKQIYDAHFGASCHFHLGDVWTTDEVVRRLPLRPFLATASFPCIDLSLAGHWRGLNGEHSSAFFGFARVLEELGQNRPRAVLLENVSGFLTSHDGTDFTSVVVALAELGFWLDAFVIDAKYFVPQSRPRVFIVGIDDELKENWQLKQTSHSLFDDAFELALIPTPLRPPTLLSLIKTIQLPTGWLAIDLPVPSYDRAALAAMIDKDNAQDWWSEAAVEKHYNMMSDRHRNHVDGLLAEGGLHVGTIFRRKRYGKTRAEVRFDGIAGCLRTPRGGSARQIVIVVDNGTLKMRWMSPREYGRLQGAADFPILEKVNQMLHGFGDAVCVPVIRWIDNNVLTPFFECAMNQERGGRAVGG